MIQAACAGIGIVGKEGKHASLAADFSLTQFLPIFQSVGHINVCRKIRYSITKKLKKPPLSTQIKTKYVCEYEECE